MSDMNHIQHFAQSVQGDTPESKPVKGLVIVDDTNDQHVPNFPLTGGMRHIGIRAKDGEIIATVWNHHHYSECVKRAELIVEAVNSFDALKQRVKVLEEALKRCVRRLELMRRDYPNEFIGSDDIALGKSALAPSVGVEETENQ